MGSSATRTRLAICVIAVASCAAPTGAEQALGEPSWGLGDKADSVGCDATAPMCWPARDASTFRAYLAATDAATLAHPRGAWDALDALARLEHKLDATELDALDRLRDSPHDVDGAELAGEIHVRVAERITTGFLAAHSVPLGARASSSGSADSAEEQLDAPGVETGGVAESLAMLKARGVFGYAYALMLEHTGVLDRTYTVDGGDASVPRDVRVREIIERYTASSTRAAVLVNIEGLIPYAGIVISVAHGSFMQFRIRARMVFEIAAVYGIDIREGHNLLLATGVMMGAFGLNELRLLWGGTLAIPFIVRGVLRAGRLVDPRALLRRLAERAVAAILEAIGRASARTAGRAGAQAVARGAARQVLGYATLGLAILGDIWLTRSATRTLGEHSAAMLRPWVTGMLLDGAELLEDDAVEDCAAIALGAAVADDGVDREQERRLLAAHLARPTWVGDTWVAPASDAVRRRAILAAGSTDGDAARCLVRTLRGAPVEHRLALLSWLRALHAVDGAIDPAENEAYADHVDRLRGASWLGDGAELNIDHLALLDAHAEIVAEPASAVGPAEDGALFDVRPTDLFEGMERTPRWALGAVETAYGRITP